MKGKLSQWIKDSEKFELMRSYHVLQQESFEFLSRSDDFYITLLNKMFFLLEEVDGNTYASKAEELLEVAKGLLIYSDKDTQELFLHIDKQENMLYVAAIYYLIGYEAIASLLAKRFHWERIGNKYGKLILYIICGGDKEDVLDTHDVKELAEKLKVYITTGRQEFLDKLVRNIDGHCESMNFATLDEFFDCYVLKHVLRKFNSNNLWYDLKKVSLAMDWSDYVAFSCSQGILQFLPSQRDAIEKGLLNYERSFSLKMPTSAGKSYITELLIYNELRQKVNGKVLYLAPLRSLSYELSERYRMVGKALKFESFAAYGGSSSMLDNNRLDNAGLFITTPEFFASMEGVDEELLDKFTLVICDEGQLLDSLNRGTNYELLLSRIKSRGVARFLFISAIIPNIEDVNIWLGGSELEVGDSQHRPCEIKLAMAEKQQRNICLHIYQPDLVNVKYDIKEFLSRRENRNVDIDKKNVLCAALGIKSVSAGSTLIFTYSKDGRYGCKKMCDELLQLADMHRYGEQLVTEENEYVIRKLHEYVAYQYGKDFPLSKYLQKGIAYHNGGLPQDIREYIEDYYRRRWIKILVSNSTLAEGVNLPIKTLVVYDLRRYNGRGWELIDSTEIRNILGRVGRAGRERYGLVILPNNDQKVYSTVIEALKGNGIHIIRGIFYDVIQMLTKYQVLTDEEVNKVLVKIGASSAIDQMIYRYYGESNDNVLELSISDSLAFHLSDANSKTYIRQAFRVRKERIDRDITTEEQLALLKYTGLKLEDFIHLETSLKEENVEELYSDETLNEKWLQQVLALVYSFPSIVSEYENLPQNIKEVIKNKVAYAQFIKAWLEGKLYWQMSRETEISIDDVMILLGHMQYHFHMRLQGLIRYLGKKYKFECESLSLLPECIRYGVYSTLHLTLIKGGLSDRIALHKVVLFIESNETLRKNNTIINKELKKHIEELELYLHECRIPQLSKEKIISWIG